MKGEFVAHVEDMKFLTGCYVVDIPLSRVCERHVSVYRFGSAAPATSQPVGGVPELVPKESISDRLVSCQVAGKVCAPLLITLAFRIGIRPGLATQSALFVYSYTSSPATSIAKLPLPFAMSICPKLKSSLYALNNIPLYVVYRHGYGYISRICNPIYHMEFIYMEQQPKKI